MGRGEKRRNQQGKAPQTGPALQELALCKEGEFVLLLILIQEAARKLDEAGFHLKSAFHLWKRTFTTPLAALWMLPKRSPETPSLLAPSQPGLLLQVLRQIAQIVAMRSVSSQQIPADGALSSPCYQHKLNTSYRHRCSHPVYTALPHSASRRCRCINETCSPGCPSAHSFPQRSPTILILLFRRLI